MSHFCETKVRKQQISIIIEEYVLRLKISIQNVLLVQMAKCQGNLSDKELCLILLEAAHTCQVSEELATLDEVHQEVDAIFVLENVVHGYDEWVLHLVEDVLFELKTFKEVLVNNHILADALHCIELIGLSLLYHVYLAKGTFSDKLKDVEVLETSYLLLLMPPTEYDRCLLAHAGASSREGTHS